jgi:hypothetical protein
MRWYRRLLAWFRPASSVPLPASSPEPRLPSPELLIPREGREGQSRDADAVDLTKLEHLDQVTRYQWSKAIAYTFITMKPTEVMIAIAAGGFELFLSRAHPVYAAHQLQREDYQRAFNWIKQAAERKAQVPIH